MLKDFEISVFKSAKDTTVAMTVSIGVMLEKIKEGFFKTQIDKIRNGDSEVKKHIPMVAFHGKFKNQRKKKDFIEASGLVILDIDDIDQDIEEVKKEIFEDSDSVYAVMQSPSGNGIKILYYVQPDLITADNYNQIGKQLVSDYDIYGHVDYLSVTDCLIVTYDPNILINEDAEPAFLYIKDKEIIQGELEELDETKRLWDDPEDFFDTVLANDIASKTNSNFHYIQVAVLDLAKFGFTHPEYDLEFVINYAEETFHVSPDNKKRFLEVAALAKEYPQTKWPYRYGSDDFYDDEGDDTFLDYSDYIKDDHNASKNDSKTSGEDFDDFMINYPTLFESVLEVAREGDRVGYEISFSNFANIFRFRGTGILTVTGIPSHGKASPMSSKVYTPNGYKLMRDIKVGDEILTQEGIAKVGGVYPQGEMDIYEITFSDGTKARSTRDHLWLCNNMHERKFRRSKIIYKHGLRKREYKKEPLQMKTRPLEDIMKNYIKKEGAYKGRKEYNIPIDIAHFSKQDLSIHPYLLGILIGDGGLSNGVIKFTHGQKSTLDYIKPMLDKFKCKISEKTIWNDNFFETMFISKSGKKNNLKIEIDKLGLDTQSINKHIPEEYIYNSIENRMALLGGLLDTDGYVSKKGDLSYSTSSKRLKDDIVNLIRSLGGSAQVSSKFPQYKLRGKKVRSKNEHYTIAIRLPRKLGNPFINNEFRKKRYKSGEIIKYISKIELVSREKAQCILVNSDSHLYFTDDFTITHNTEFVDAITLDLARLYNQGTIIVGFEQSPEEHIIKLMRRMVGVNITCPTYLNKGNEKEVKENFDFITSRIRHIDTKKTGGNINTILDAAAQEIKKQRDSGKQINYVVLDPFNMLSIKGVRLSGHEKIEEILRRITHFSHQMNVLVILIAHPFKMKVDEKTGAYAVPDFYSVKGSSAFFEMSYHGLVVYRTGYSANDPVFVRVLKVKQNNMGTTGEEAHFIYEKNSGRYIPIDTEGNELKGDHREKKWLNKVNEK